MSHVICMRLLLIAEVFFEVALLTCNAERQFTAEQNVPTSPTNQTWMMYDGEGHRVEQYASGGLPTAAWFHLRLGERSGLDLDVRPNLQLPFAAAQ